MQTQPRAGLIGLFLCLLLARHTLAAPIYSSDISSTYTPSHSTLQSKNLPPTFDSAQNIYATPITEHSIGHRMAGVSAEEHMHRRGFFDSFVHAVKHVEKTAVKDVKKAEKSAVKFAKKDGPMIEKVGLKSIATAAEASSKIVGFTPLGKPLAIAMKFGGKELNKASNHIHAKTPPNVNKALKDMDKAQKILKFIP